jgi:hypothetical protein
LNYFCGIFERKTNEGKIADYKLKIKSLNCTCPRQEGIKGSRGIAPLILNLSTR